MLKKTKIFNTVIAGFRKNDVQGSCPTINLKKDDDFEYLSKSMIAINKEPESPGLRIYSEHFSWTFENSEKKEDNFYTLADFVNEQIQSESLTDVTPDYFTSSDSLDSNKVEPELQSLATDW